MKGSKKSWKTTFYGRYQLDVYDEVYEPAEDTLLLADNLNFVCPKRILDMGTGCGLFSILAAEKGCEVVAVDISPYATRCAAENLMKYGLKGKVHIIQGDLFDSLRDSPLFDTIIFNPPYLPSEDEKGCTWLEKAWCGGLTGRNVIDRFTREAPRYLKPNGKIFLIQSSLSGIDETLTSFRNLGFETVILGEVNLDFEKLVLICARRGS